jgi:hypothetical protein
MVHAMGNNRLAGASEIATLQIMMKNYFLLMMWLVAAQLTYAQNDTIKVEEAVSIQADEQLSATGLKAGDTTWAFTVAEDVTVNTLRHKNFPVIKKGATVIAVVETSVLPYKMTMKQVIEMDRQQGTHTPPGDFWVRSQVEIRFVAVQAVDGTFLPFSDCRKTFWPENLEQGKKEIAKVPIGSRKTCNTAYSSRLIFGKKD